MFVTNRVRYDRLFGVVAASAQTVRDDTRTAPSFDAALAAAKDLPRLHSLLVSRDGTLVLERYFNGARAARPVVETAEPPGDRVFSRALHARISGALKAGGWCNLLIDDGSPERLLSVSLAGAAAGLELVDVIHRESARSGDGLVLHFRKPSAEDRLRQAVRPGPLRLGAESGHLTYPELAAVIGVFYVLATSVLALRAESGSNAERAKRWLALLLRGGMLPPRLLRSSIHFSLVRSVVSSHAWSIPCQPAGTGAGRAPSARSFHMKPNRSWPGVPNRYSTISSSIRIRTATGARWTQRWSAG